MDSRNSLWRSAVARAPSRTNEPARLIQTKIEVVDGAGAARRLVNIDKHGVHLHVAGGHFAGYYFGYFGLLGDRRMRPVGCKE